MRVIVCGDRNWSDHKVMLRELKKLPAGAIIVEGGCRGADLMAASIAKELGLIVEEHPAKWGQYGRSAGPIRNREMMDAGAELVLAFHKDFEHSRGTKDMITVARAKGVATYIYSE